MVVEDDMMVGFEPPSLSSLRCDMMMKIGELDREKEFVPSRDLNNILEENDDGVQAPPVEKKSGNNAPKTSGKGKPSEDETDQPIRDSLSL
jgi:hypothetical protein